MVKRSGCKSNETKIGKKCVVLRKEMTLADHAEAWHSEKGNKVPKRNTKAWGEMYKKWVNYAFGDF